MTRSEGNPGWRRSHQLTTGMLILLGHDRQLYLHVHEMKAERQRWIRSIALQTTDPATE
jgi:hypothetical protein